MGFAKLEITISVDKMLFFDFCKNGNWELNAIPSSSEEIFRTGVKFLFTSNAKEKLSTPDNWKRDESGIKMLGFREISERKSNLYWSSKFSPLRKIIGFWFKNCECSRPKILSKFKA